MLILVVAVAGLIEGVQRAEANYRATLVYKNAELCTAAPPVDAEADCVVSVTGRVLGKATGQSCTANSNGGQSCTTHYRVQVRHAGDTHWLDVPSHTYRDVERGDRAELRLWRGDVVWMAVRGHTAMYLASAELALLGWLVLAWVLLGAAWSSLGGFRLVAMVPGWLVLTVPYLLIVYGELFDPMGVVAWSFTVSLTAAGIWVMVWGFRESAYV
ncbi:hypothetical protein ACFVWX_10105 [Streptomyces sp. NPDC058220]|uniref:hypothetical protein n=1 Tax=unclassified Streptomyces TaxID=2593676 RepID=UPI0036657EC1